MGLHKNLVNINMKRRKLSEISGYSYQEKSKKDKIDEDLKLVCPVAFFFLVRVIFSSFLFFSFLFYAF